MEVGLPQFYIRNSTNTPLIGHYNPVIEESEVRPYGPNAFIEVLPFEMLYTAETSPQVRVMVGDMPALCASLECDYDYFETTALVTDMTVSGQTVTLTGTDLPIDDILMIEVSNMECVAGSTSASSITCDIADDWTAGTWLPHIKTSMGVVPIDSSISPHVVTHTIASISPSILNPAGGDTVVI